MHWLRASSRHKALTVAAARATEQRKVGVNLSAETAELFRYKKWANRELLDQLAELSCTYGEASVHIPIRILNHTHVVDQIFAAHLRGEVHAFEATNTANTPTVAELDASLTLVDDWLVDYSSRVSSAELTEVIRFRFTEGNFGQMTRAQMLIHLLNHGSYHRGAIGQIIKDRGQVPPADTLARFVRETQT